jgi:hypothetical protein
MTGQGETTVVTALRKARTGDENPATRKFQFRQHLPDLGTINSRLPLVQKAIEGIYAEVRRRIQ